MSKPTHWKVKRAQRRRNYESIREYEIAYFAQSKKTRIENTKKRKLITKAIKQYKKQKALGSKKTPKEYIEKNYPTLISLTNQKV